MPDPIPINKPAVAPENMEGALQILLNAFWKSYFNGGVHDLGTGPLQFPKCEIAFNQTVPALSGPCLHTVFTSMRPLRQHEAVAGEEGLRLSVDAVINLFVRVPNEGQKQAGGDVVCQQVAGLCKLLFDAPAERGRLSQKGVLRPKVVSGPLPQPFPGMQVRSMVITAELVCRI